jgi:nucleotide-binding universal stress UspA family protein
MPEKPTAFTLRNILFATDFSPASNTAFEYAVTIADWYNSNLYVAHVINREAFDLTDAESSAGMLDQARERAHQKINELFGTRHLQADRFHALVSEGAVPEVLLDIIRRKQVDMAVLGTHGRRAFKKLLLGSIAEEVFRMAHCPVLTVGPRTAPPRATVAVRHILYPLEFAPDSSEAAKCAVSLAEQHVANLTVMNVHEDMPSSNNRADQGNEAAERWLEDHIPPGSDLRSRVHLERGSGPAPTAILNFAANAGVDVIVMSVRPLDPIMAAHVPKPDTAYDVVSRASCAVLTVR